MKFITALKHANQHSRDESISKSVVLFSSVNNHNISVYLNAYANISKAKYIYRSIEFGTLRQSLNSYLEDENTFPLILLFPWDFSTLSSWRQNSSVNYLSYDQFLIDTDNFFLSIGSIEKVAIHYFDFPLPFHQLDTDKIDSVKSYLISSSNKFNFNIHGNESFSFSSFIKIGNPFKQSSLENLSKAIHFDLDKKIYFYKREGKRFKVIFTDLDNTFWPGILADDGLESINSLDVEHSQLHLHYRLFLRRLALEGILIIAISRNDMSYIEESFKRGIYGFESNLITSILCSYGSKSKMILNCLSKLNLNSSDAVFIDDNDIEINEVKEAIPDIKTFSFSTDESLFISLLTNLHLLFGSKLLTEEDRNRRVAYASMLDFKENLNTLEINYDQNKLTNYLNSLNMTLKISLNPAETEKERAIQLINKTSQFNANGINIENLEQNSNLITATLTDSSVKHGLVIACVISQEKKITSFVMSCRVFQRGIEKYFLNFIKKNNLAHEILVKSTNKNIPFNQFISKTLDLSIATYDQVTTLSLANKLIKLPVHKINIEYVRH